MPGTLRVDRLNLSNIRAIEQLISALATIAGDRSKHHGLEVSKRYYFAIPDGPITDCAGWYVIRAGVEPIYVGTAENLNARLNSENGSRDQFANPQRTSDPERNFIKAFTSLGLLNDLTVTILPEPELCSVIGIDPPLTKRDRHNVEKILNIFRCRVACARQ